MLTHIPKVFSLISVCCFSACWYWEPLPVPPADPQVAAERERARKEEFLAAIERTSKTAYLSVATVTDTQECNVTREFVPPSADLQEACFWEKAALITLTILDPGNNADVQAGDVIKILTPSNDPQSLTVGFTNTSNIVGYLKYNRDLRIPIDCGDNQVTHFSFGDVFSNDDLHDHLATQEEALALIKQQSLSDVVAPSQDWPYNGFCTTIDDTL